MSLFRCEECGVVENTATSHYWFREQQADSRALCSQCDPEIGRWHGIFERVDADAAGYVPRAGDSPFIELPREEARADV